MRNCPFDDLYLIRQLCHASKRLSDVFPNLNIGVHPNNLFSNLLFILAVDNLVSEQTSFGKVAEQILGGKRVVWNLTGTPERPTKGIDIIPVKFLFQMIPDPKVREWLLDMEERELLEKI